MKREIDAEYDALLNELQAALDEDERLGPPSERVEAFRDRIEELLREQMRAEPEPSRRTGPDALN